MIEFEIGRIAVLAIFIFALLSTFFYFFSYFKEEKLNKTGSVFYYLLTAGILFVSMFLLSNIVAHNFQYTYIWQYSSRELETPFLIASFYSGQQGSFLLWAVLLTLMGFVLLPYARKKNYESLVMGLFSLILTIIIFLLVIKSPFEYVWETFAADNVEAGFVPPNGRGLNPVLQNYWISIHPPILFTGFAAMTVPFTFAVAGLIKREYRNWIPVAIPWTLFATAILGFGIMLGGFWAYETLGWGGFWGWDPVENSSLLPWLTAIALVHTMYVHRKTGGLIRTNFVLAMLSFLLVLYSTFLTRSGILGDTSVHSFVDPGQIVYLGLLIFMILFFVIGLLALVLRFKDIPGAKITFNITSKEFALSIGIIAILASALVIFLGTSKPIFDDILGRQKAAVDISVYNDFNLPIAIIILLLNAFSLYLKWRSTKITQVLKSVAIGFAIAIILTSFKAMNGIGEFSYLVLIFSSWFALIINLEFVIRTIIKKPKSTGAYVSHVGLAMLILGAIASGGYSESKNITLKENQSAKAFGYNITYKHREQVEKQKRDRQKFEYNLVIEKDGKEYTAKPVVYWSTFNNMESPYFEPAIESFYAKDLYFSPTSVSTDIGFETLVMHKQDIRSLPVDSSIKFEMLEFDMSHSNLSVDSKGALIGAVFNIHHKGEFTQDTLFTNLSLQTGVADPLWYLLPGGKYEAGFLQLVPNQQNMGQSEIVIAFKEKGKELPEPTTVFSFEASTKPFIYLVWFGTIAMVLGFFIAITKYTGKNAKKFNDDNTAPEKGIIEDSSHMTNGAPQIDEKSKEEKN